MALGQVQPDDRDGSEELEAPPRFRHSRHAMNVRSINAASTPDRDGSEELEARPYRHSRQPCRDGSEELEAPLFRHSRRQPDRDGSEELEAPPFRPSRHPSRDGSEELEAPPVRHSRRAMNVFSMSSEKEVTHPVVDSVGKVPAPRKRSTKVSQSQPPPRQTISTLPPPVANVASALPATSRPAPLKKQQSPEVSRIMPLSEIRRLRREKRDFENLQRAKHDHALLSEYLPRPSKRARNAAARDCQEIAVPLAVVRTPDDQARTVLVKPAKTHWRKAQQDDKPVIARTTTLNIEAGLPEEWKTTRLWAEHEADTDDDSDNAESLIAPRSPTELDVTPVKTTTGTEERVVKLTEAYEKLKSTRIPRKTISRYLADLHDDWLVNHSATAVYCGVGLWRAILKLAPDDLSFSSSTVSRPPPDSAQHDTAVISAVDGGGDDSRPEKSGDMAWDSTYEEPEEIKCSEMQDDMSFPDEYQLGEEYGSLRCVSCNAPVLLSNNGKERHEKGKRHKKNHLKWIREQASAAELREKPLPPFIGNSNYKRSKMVYDCFLCEVAVQGDHFGAEIEQHVRGACHVQLQELFFEMLATGDGGDD